MSALKGTVYGLKRTIKILMLLLVVAVTIPASLLGTADGIAWLIRMADEQIPGDLRVGEVTGNLYGDLQLEGLHYSDPAMRLELDSVTLRWAPMELLHKRLHIVQLSVANGHFEQLQTSPQTPSEPLTGLPDIGLPLAIALDQVEVDGFTLISTPRAEPLVLEKAQLRAQAEGQEITLETLAASLKDLIAVQLDGRVQSAGDWPLALNNQVQLKLPDLPRFALAGQVSGDMQLLKLQQTLSGGADAQLQADIAQPLKQLSWKTDLTLSSLSAEVRKLAGIALPAQLNAEVKGEGDLQQAKAAVALHLGNTLPETPAEASAAKAAQSLELTGSLQFEQLQFQAQGKWQGVQWPLAGAAQVVTESGGLEIEGSADDYHFALNARIQGPDIPPGAWTAKGSGSTERVKIETLHGKVLGGELQAGGEVAWSPQLQWQADLAGSGIDPGQLAQEWPGSLAFELGTQGTLADGGQRIGVVIKKLQGKLRELPLAGNGEFHMDGKNMEFREIHLSSGQAKLQANGQLHDQWDLDWSIDVADLADLLPEAQGRLRGTGKLTGNAELPNVRAQLAANGVQFQDLQLQQLEGDLDLRPSGGAAAEEIADINLKAQGLGNADNLLESLTLKVSGPLKTQSIQLSAVHPLAALELAAQGALDLDQQSWQGTLGRLDLDAGEWGKWGLQAPVTLAASPEAVTTSTLCLGEGATSLCAEADWKPAGGSAKAKLKEFSFERLKPLLPENVAELEGGVDATLDATLGPQLGADLTLTLEPGQITYLLDEVRQVRLSYQGGDLKAKYDSQALAAKLQLKMEQNDIAGELRIPRAALDKDPLSAPMKGRLNFDFQQLGLATAFVPAIEKSEGRIHGALKLAGVLGLPKVSGDVVLDMDALVIPNAGLDLQDLKVTVNGDGRRLSVKGGVSSGPGRLELTGGAELDAAKGWPAQLSLKGERFQAVALPEAVVFVSPDIQVEHGAQGLKARGSITVPETNIHLIEIPSSARTVSSDLVIVDSDGNDQGQPAMPIDAKVTLILGDSVKFSGFGLDADLGGKLTVTQEPETQPVGHGEIGIVKGSYRFFGQALDIDRGKLFYAGGSLTNPGLDIQASRQVDSLTVGVLVTGTAKNPRIKAFSSDPAMSERDARSLLLTGTTQGSGSSASVYAGTHLTDRLTVGTNVAVDGSGTEFVARYKISRKLSLKTTSSSSTSGGELLYTIEFK